MHRMQKQEVKQEDAQRQQTICLWQSNGGNFGVACFSSRVRSDARESELGK